MIFLIESIRKLTCQAQEPQSLKINYCLNRILHGIAVSGRTKMLQRSKINDFLNRILNGIELSARKELEKSQINDFVNRILNEIELSGPRGSLTLFVRRVARLRSYYTL